MENVIQISVIFILMVAVISVFSSEVLLRFTEEPQDALYDTDYPEGSATFHCKADGQPKPDITWYNNDREITEGGIYSITEEGSLQINNLTNNYLNGSSYHCVASNSFGSAMSQVATLRLAHVGEFLRPPGAVSIEVNQGTCITCNPPEAYPGISTIWRKDVMDRITPDDRIRVMLDGRLCFAHARSEDTGSYDCLVANIYSMHGASYENSESFRFHATQTVKIPPQSLKEADDMEQRVTVKEGQVAILECFFLGRPTPSLQWSRPGLDLPSSANMYHNNQELRISNAQPEDSGEYLCTGTDTDDEATVSRHLTVISPPILALDLENKEVESGNTVSFQCKANASDVTYLWYHNVNSTSSTERHHISEDNILTIENVMPEDSGIYQCTAANNHGMRISTAQLRVTPQEPNTENPDEPGKTPPGNGASAREPGTNQPGNGTSDIGAGVHVFSMVIMVLTVMLELI